MKICRITMCPRPAAVTTVGGVAFPNAPHLACPFCAEHEVEFAASPEGRNLTPTSRSDFRDRVWKETCALDEAKKRAQAEHDAKLKAERTAAVAAVLKN